MTTTPREALVRLRAAVGTGEVEQLCSEHELDLLVVHGSAVEQEPLRPPADLDIACRHRLGAELNAIGLINDLMELTCFDAIDLLDLNTAGVVATARALSPQSLLLYEAEPSLFTLAQIAALTTDMETRRFRLLDLKLMAGR
ncbi:nucleotidyltransferase domain-containing protein [Bounagaea algeriensis]